MRRPAIPHASTPEQRAAKEVTTQSPDRLFTVEETAERLGTGVRFVRRLIQERRIRYVKLGKPVRIPESAVTAYIQERTVPSLQEARVARFGKAA